MSADFDDPRSLRHMQTFSVSNHPGSIKYANHGYFRFS